MADYGVVQVNIHDHVAGRESYTCVVRSAVSEMHVDARVSHADARVSMRLSSSAVVHAPAPRADCAEVQCVAMACFRSWQRADCDDVPTAQAWQATGDCTLEKEVCELELKCTPACVLGGCR